MITTYNKTTNLPTRYYRIAEFENVMNEMKKISGRIKYQVFGEKPETNPLEDYNVVVDDAKSIEKLMAETPEFKLETCIDTLHRTLFLISCGLSGDTEGIEYLISKGAEINRCDLCGENALMYIIKNENMPVDMKVKAVQLLIDKGIDVNWINIQFETPLMMALNYTEFEIANILIDNGAIIYKPNIAKEEAENKENDISKEPTE